MQRRLDALGSVAATTNASQQQTTDVRYSAFGTEQTYNGSLNTFGWNGKSQYQKDRESGLMLLGHRYYDQSTGRFLSQDPARDGANWYAYCENNPLTAVDPSGLTQQPANKGTGVIIVGDTEVGRLQGAVDQAVEDHVRLSTKYYSQQGYESIAVYTNPTREQVGEILKNKEVQALTWIGHEAFPGGVLVKAKGDESPESMRGIDFESALGGRKLREAAFWVCHSNHDNELRNAIVGPKGHWTGSAGTYSPITKHNNSLQALSTMGVYMLRRALGNVPWGKGG